MVQRRVSNRSIRGLVVPVLLILFVAATSTLVARDYSASRYQASAREARGDLVDVRVNQITAADQQEPSLAVDPTNANNMIAAAKDWRTGPKQVWSYRSTDGGSTWADGYPNLLPVE